MKNKQVIVQDWGVIDYFDAWQRQEQLFNKIIQDKITLRSLSKLSDSTKYDEIKSNSTANYLVFCEHPHVFTLGKSGKPENLLLDEQGLLSKGVSFSRTNRGGDITYHGPGQLVCYPILDLENFFTDIHLYLRTLEKAVLLTLSDYGLKADLEPKFTGVWFDPLTNRSRKIAAMGVRCSRWVTMHGLSLNVNPDLSYFNHIIACGLEAKGITSMKIETGKELDIQDVKNRLQHYIGEVFGMVFSSAEY